MLALAGVVVLAGASWCQLVLGVVCQLVGRFVLSLFLCDVTHCLLVECLMAGLPGYL